MGDGGCCRNWGMKKFFFIPAPGSKFIRADDRRCLPRGFRRRARVAEPRTSCRGRYWLLPPPWRISVNHFVGGKPGSLGGGTTQHVTALRTASPTGLGRSCSYCRSFQAPPRSAGPSPWADARRQVWAEKRICSTRVSRRGRRRGPLPPEPRGQRPVDRRGPHEVRLLLSCWCQVSTHRSPPRRAGAQRGGPRVGAALGGGSTWGRGWFCMGHDRGVSPGCPARPTYVP